MGDEQRSQGNGADSKVKVTDRRRFTPEGEALTEEAGAEASESAGPRPDPRETTSSDQATRIEQLTRAYASLVEEGKAARVRLEREKSRVLEAERAQVAQVLLDAVDELERALAAAAGASGPLVDGVVLILASLKQKVGELGAERFAVLGKPFDPRLHEALDVVPVVDPAQDEVVVEEVRAGYRVGERVLRPARVRVGRLVQAG
jgi:molecular chaperone GrpE